MLTPPRNAYWPPNHTKDESLHPHLIFPCHSSEEENKIELVTNLLLPRDFNDKDAEELINLSEYYYTQIPLTLCDVDCKNTSRILDKLKKFINDYPAISSSTKKKLEDLCHKIQNLVANIHIEEDRNKIYENHLARMKEFFSMKRMDFLKDTTKTI